MPETQGSTQSRISPDIAAGQRVQAMQQAREAGLRVGFGNQAGQKVQRIQQAIQAAQGEQADPNLGVTPGPGFIPFDVVEGKAKLDQVFRVMADQLRFMSEPEIEKREADFQRTFASDLLGKGTPAYLLSGKLAKQLKRFGRKPTTTGFVTGAVLGDIAGESVLQAIEIGAGVRDKFSFEETALSATLTGLTGGVGTLFTKMAGRIGGVAPRPIKEAAFSNFFRQLRLILPRRVSAQFARSYEFGKAAELQKQVGRVIRPSFSEMAGAGVSNEEAILPSAMRNVDLIRRADEAGVTIDVRPLLDSALEFAQRFERITIQRPTHSAVSETLDFAANLESALVEKFGSTKIPASALNQILQEVREPLKAAFARRGGRETVAITSTEGIRNKIFERISGMAKRMLHQEMDTFSKGAFSKNAGLTRKILSNAEQLAKRLSDKDAVNLLRSVHKDGNEGVLALLAEFDNLNGTRFVEESWELFLNRELTVSQMQKIQGLARTVAPFLVVMRQVATKIAVPLLRPMTATAGTLTSVAIREEQRLNERLQAEIAQREPELSQLLEGGQAPKSLEERLQMLSPEDRLLFGLAEAPQPEEAPAP